MSENEVSVSLYDAVGGDTFFLDLVRRFYAAVADDPVLAAMHPPDLARSERHTGLFLIQYWGGPTTYDEERGHPRLRMRHHPFPIDQAARDAWLHHMVDAVDATLADPPTASLLAHPDEGPSVRTGVRQMLVDYFERASTAMINRGEPAL